MYYICGTIGHVLGAWWAPVVPTVQPENSIIIQSWLILWAALHENLQHCVVYMCRVGVLVKYNFVLLKKKCDRH